MNIKHIIICCIGILQLALTGCSAYTLTNSEVASGANLRSYRTFRIASPKERVLPKGMTEVTYYNIAAAIREQMVERGFVESPQADLLVNFGITVQTDETVVPYTNTATTIAPPAPMPGPGPAVGPGPRPGHGPGRPNRFAPMFVYPRTFYTTYTQWVPTVYKQGTLVMDLVDLPAENMLYTSSVATILDGSGRLQTLEGIAEAVKVLFSKFPIPQQKQ